VALRPTDVACLGGGTLVTAGNLVFQGLANGEFFAYNATTGEELWSFAVDTTLMAGPVTYTVDDEQYVAILAGRGGGAGLVGGPTGKRWQKIINENRVLVFKLGGDAELPAMRKREHIVDIPAELLIESEDKDLVARGQKVYEQYCYMCHGIGAMSGGVIPDLRFAAAQTFEEWPAIVIGGSRAEQGMRSFAGALSTEDAMAIRAYVMKQASRVRR
jgi:quinohemoprotein ethanol dehydrogenase